MLDGKLSVVMPAYNESEYIAANILETVKTLSDFGYDYEVVVVDDGSPDNTYLQALSVLPRCGGRVRIIRYDNNRGKGGALVCGTAFATGNYIAFLDADMDLHPVQLPVLLEMMAAQEADVVVGSKHHPNSNVIYPRVRKLYSLGYYVMVRALFGLPVRDTQTGIKIFKSTVLRDIFPRVLVKRFAFSVELLTLAHRRGYKIVEAPVTLNFRRVLSRISAADVRNMLQDTLAIFYRMRLMAYYDQRTPEINPSGNTNPAREVTVDEFAKSR